MIVNAYHASLNNIFRSTAFPLRKHWRFPRRNTYYSLQPKLHHPCSLCI